MRRAMRRRARRRERGRRRPSVVSGPTGRGARHRASRPVAARRRARSSPSSAPSGCGKSTLLELICGLQAPDAGRSRPAPAVLMPQRDLLLPWASALDNAALALRVARRRGAEPRASARARCSQRFGLARLRGARGPSELSGGMRQRVAFVRTLLAGKPVLALDEPFAALDALTAPGDAGAGSPARCARAAHRRARHPRRRGGGRARRPRRRDVAAARAGRGRARRRRCRGRGTRTDAARRRAARAGAAGAGSAGVRRAPPWLARRPRSLARAARRAGSCTPTSAASTSSCCPPRTRSRTALWTDRALLWDNFTVTAGEVLLGHPRVAGSPASPARSRSTSRSRCGAPSTRCWSPRRRSRS